jgi:hypothetical protein
MPEPTPFDPEPLIRRLIDEQVDFIVIGGLAATLMGAVLPTYDLDNMYERSRPNLDRMAEVLRTVDVRLRGAEDLPLRVDALLLRNGDAFTFTTTSGALTSWRWQQGRRRTMRWQGAQSSSHCSVP